MSGVPPGAKGTIIVTGRSGQFAWARAAKDPRITAGKASRARRGVRTVMAAFLPGVSGAS
jgi:hypothetical protein